MSARTEEDATARLTADADADAEEVQPEVTSDEAKESGETVAPTRDSVVTLREITAENAEEIFTLQVAPGQEDFVANNERSIAQAHFSKNAWYRAIYADETPVGFVMLYDDPETPYYFLWRLMVDGRYQRMGFGAAAIELLKEHVRKRPGAEHLVTSYVPQKGGPGPFYMKLGFEKTGEMEDDEEIVAVALW